ncbi:MAG: response regulator [Alphaproteobacteria bacterium]
MNSSAAGPPSHPPQRGHDDDRDVLEAVSQTLDRVRLLLRKHATRRETLIATADPALAQSVRAVLAMHGHQAFWVTGGVEAAATAACRRFDLILLDLDAPQQCLAGARRIRALPEPFGQAPIAAFVSRLDPTLEDEAIEAGLDAFLPKPLAPERLVKIATLLIGVTREADAE